MVAMVKAGWWIIETSTTTDETLSGSEGEDELVGGNFRVTDSQGQSWRSPADLTFLGFTPGPAWVTRDPSTTYPVSSLLKKVRTLFSPLDPSWATLGRNILHCSSLQNRDLLQSAYCFSLRSKCATISRVVLWFSLVFGRYSSFLCRKNRQAAITCHTLS